MVSSIDLIKKHEGCRLTAYKDTLGIWTIGYGYTHGVKEFDTCTQEQAEKWLASEIEECIKDLEEFHWFNGLDDNRKSVLIDMRYQLGMKGLLAFKNFICYLTQKKWDDAASEGLKSRWAKQTPQRAAENMNIIRFGK